ncbi:hypothetical protein CLAFUR4_14341 [Fulvia fulva]|nr:hypothetical protein CLAFUR4_14341 [Fulvia fulva]WPV37753.1 hypothetical protein CLAFUW7_14349 [Fulvia fulva]
MKSSPILYMACIIITTSLQPPCILVRASPVFSNFSGLDTRIGWTANTTNGHLLVGRGPLDILDRAYSKAKKKGEKRWADSISASMEQRQGEFLEWDVLVEKAESAEDKQGGEQPVAKNSGWRYDLVESQAEMDDVTKDYTAALNGAKLTTENSRNVVMLHKTTDARCKGLYSPSNALLIAYERHSPSYQTSTHSHLTPSDIPAITQWSDIAFLTWMHTLADLSLTPAEAPLKHIFIGPITNTESIDVIKKAIKEAGYKGKGLPSFEEAVELKRPGAVVGRGDRPFMGVLGTDNLAGVGYLLAQHREVLGRRGVGVLVVFGSGGNLYVKVEVVDW